MKCPTERTAQSRRIFRILPAIQLLFSACQGPVDGPNHPPTDPGSSIDGSTSGGHPDATSDGSPSNGNNPGTVTKQGDIIFESARGWFEYAFDADTAYVGIDIELVRGTRMDLPGLLGNHAYSIKVVPVVGGAPAPVRASEIKMTTKAHDRSGFAFDQRSPRGASGTSGGYNPDGTVNPAATILYLTDANKDTIQLAVTKGNTTTTHTGIVPIQAALSSAKSTKPLIIRFIGTVTAPAGLDTLKMMQLKDNSNVTYEGIGDDAQLNGWGLDFQRDTNIEVRNLSFKEQPEDQLSFQSTCLNLWIHHNDHFLGKGLPGDDADKLYGDGPLDIKSGSSWVSVSYNRYHATQKSNGVGFGDDTTALVMTYHHNLYDVCGSRMPRISFVSMHVYNTYFKEAQIYAIAAANGCSAFIQNNFFEKSNRPMIIASQGHDLTPSGSTLSNDPGGTIKILGNYMDSYSSDPVRFNPAVDASLGPAVLGGAVYNDFDADFGANYPQALDSPEDAKIKVITYAGRIRN
jgi:pectate lyase